MGKKEKKKINEENLIKGISFHGPYKCLGSSIYVMVVLGDSDIGHEKCIYRMSDKPTSSQHNQ